MCHACAGNVQFVTGPDGQPTEAILYGTGAQATFQNTAGQVVVVTNNSPETVSIPIDTNGDPSIPVGTDLSVVSTNPSIPSTPTSSSSGGNSKQNADCWALHICIFAHLPLSPLASPPAEEPSFTICCTVDKLAQTCQLDISSETGMLDDMCVAITIA